MSLSNPRLHARAAGPKPSNATPTLVAAILNFGSVIVGLGLIIWQASGSEEIAFLNLWSAWGLFHGLFGQIGLISGVLDDNDSRSATVLRNVVIAFVIAALGAFLLRGRLFPDHGSWWVAVGIIAAFTYFIGRHRSELTRRNRGSAALWIEAIENVMRLLLIGIVLAVGNFDFAALAVVAPFAVSMALLTQANRDESSDSETSVATAASLATGVLAGLPVLFAFAILPVLSVLERTNNFDRLAIAVMIARGPVVLGGFVSPLLLEADQSVSSKMKWSLAKLTSGLFLAQLAWLTFANSTGDVNMAVLALSGGIAAGATYALILAGAPSMQTSGAPCLAIGGGAVVFTVLAVLLTTTSGASALIALTGACAMISIVVASQKPSAAVEPVAVVEDAPMPLPKNVVPLFPPATDEEAVADKAGKADRAA